MQNLIPASQLVEFDDEARIRDVDLAERLEFARPADIRELIARNSEELSTYGNFPYRTEKSEGRGRPGKAYYLNEGQALVICALSRTGKAAQVRKAVIDVFMAYRQGKLVHVDEHYRSKPNRAQRRQAFQSTFEENLEFINANVRGIERQTEFMATLMTRLQNLEIAAFGEHKTARALGRSVTGNGYPQRENRT